MCHKLLVLLKLLLFFQEILGRCPASPAETCDCWNKLGAEDYTLRCPKSTTSNEMPKFIVKVKRNEILHIECDPSVSINPETILTLPQFNFQNFETLRLIWCHLASNITFSDIISALQITDVQTIRFQNWGSNTMSEIAREHFENLEDQNINRIEITGVLKSATIPQDLFYDFSNLSWLSLNENRDIKFESGNVLDPLVNLQVLELSDNEFKTLPQNIFKNLQNLKWLSLRKNQLTLSDDDTVFKNLNSLVELDLSDNNITQLPANIFYKLVNLEKLYLSGNSIKHLGGLIFKNNKKLSVLNLSENLLEKIDESLFKNLENLQTVTINSCHLKEVSENAFSSLQNIEDISLVDNQLQSLSDHVFERTKNLKTLKLGHNLLSKLSDSLFGRLTKLENLYLNNNHLTKISGGLFQNLINLKSLNLENNKITEIHLNAFVQNEKLETINLSNNLLEFSIFSTPFGKAANLKYLNLSGNRITHISDDWKMSLIHLQKLDLSHNQIKKLTHYNLQFIAQDLTVDLQYNEISHINMIQFETITRRMLQDKQLDEIIPNKIILSHNPFNCDCFVYDFFRYVHNKMDPKVRAKYHLITDDLICQKPKEHQGRPVQSIKLNEIFCPMEKFGINMYPCPENCTCNFMPFDKNLYVNCSYQNLLQLPSKLPGIFPNIVLDVTHNNLETLVIDFNENDTYRNVSILKASHNHISKVSLKNGKSKPILKALQLHKNNLRNIDANMLNITTLRNITLFENPWICSCDLVSFVRSDKRISTLSKMYCGDTIENKNYAGKKILELSLDELCQVDQSIYIGVTFSLVFVCLVMSLVVVYLRHKTAIKVWLYHYNIYICIWPNDSERNEPKLWDAFISYAHQDESFVVNELMPNLERTKPYFRLCLHHRDWIAGEWIPDQIAFSVENSSRTIVVLSKDFLKSVWGRMEFRVAHLNAITERKARVIIVKLEDIGPLDELDSELRAYLQLNTYIEWGTKDFWARLRYALPHKMNLSEEGQVMKRVIEKSLEHTQLNIEDSIKGNKLIRV